MVHDLRETVKVLARFGPRLPGIVEDLLIAQSQMTEREPRRVWPGALLWSGLGAAAGAAIMALVVGLG